MLKKAEVFRRNEPRKNPKRPRVAKSKKPLGNASVRAGKKAAVALESSATTPSRRSTRSGQNRGRPSENLERRERSERTDPKARAGRAKARVSRVRGKRA